MDIPANVQAAISRLNAANNNAYNAVTNPNGLAQGGHRQVFVPLLQGVATIGAFVADQATVASQKASLTAEDRTATGQDRQAAAHSAETAGTSAMNAANALDAFDDRMLGPKAADPTTDNDDNPLLVGAVYFNTTLNVMKVWNGAAWQVFIPGAADYVQKTRLISSGAGLTGGGDLSSDRTLAIDIPTKVEAEAGANNAKVMTPLRVADAIKAQSPMPGLVFLSSQTVSTAVANVTFTGISNAFDEYIVELIGVTPSGNAPLLMIVSTDNGSSFFTSADYLYNALVSNSSTVTVSYTSSAGAFNLSLVSVDATAPQGGLSLSVKLLSPSEAKQFRVEYIGSVATAGNVWPVFGAGRRNVAVDVDAVRFQFGSGNIASGTFKLYGMRKS